jgi:hypothetical protein
MKRISLIAALLGAIVLAFAGIAMAATPSTTLVATTGNSNVGGAKGNGMAVSHYTATYNDPVFGAVSCTGINQVKNGKMQDQFTCTSTQGGLLGGYQPGQVINWGPNTWISDFDGTSYDKTFTSTISADGMSYTGVATYQNTTA